jgi:hypothetical protein
MSRKHGCVGTLRIEGKVLSKGDVNLGFFREVKCRSCGGVWMLTYTVDDDGVHAWWLRNRSTESAPQKD